MVRATQDDTVYYEGGARVSGPPIRPGVRLFTGRTTVPTMGVGLPEAHMLRASLGIPSVATHVTTTVTLPGWMTAPLLRWMPRGPGALRTDDGVAATAHALAASVAWMAASDPPPGAFLPDELLGLGEMMSRILALAQGDFQLTLHSKLAEPPPLPNGLSPQLLRP